LPSIGTQAAIMKLMDALNNEVRIRLICKSCTAQQPAYVHIMIEEHGPNEEFDIALKSAPCFFCNVKGNFTVLVSKVE
jgi:hypothetical protein